MSEETMVATETVSEETTQEASTDLTNEGALIAESKKYRKRSQVDRAEIEKLKAEMAKTEEAKMLAEGKKDEVLAKYKADNEALAADANWAKEYKANKRAELLELHPEDDREELAKLPFATLEYVTNKINSVKANAPEVAGNTRQPEKPMGDWTKMSPDDLRDNWETIVKNAASKQTK
jgi:hypothetical protein